MALSPELSAGLTMLALLQVKHFICDGPLQTKQMVDEKRRYGAPMGLAHAGIHGIGTLLVMMVMLGFAPLAIGLGVLDTVVHYHVDFTKENVVKRMGWTPAQGPFWWAMTFDQMLHHLTYLALTALALSWP